MRAMSLLKLALLLVVYVSLDFANPMMPGAVTFDTNDSVEGRKADRGRDADADAVASRLPATTALRHATVQPARIGSARPAPQGAPVWQVHVRRVYSTAAADGSGSSTPSEDS
jgi:hypothetical protein